MGDWQIKWNFDKEVYSPGESVFAHFWVENRGQTILFVDEICMQYEWQGSQSLSIRCSKQVPVGSDQYVGMVFFEIPIAVAGSVMYRVGYHMWEHQTSLCQWQDLGFYWSEQRYFINSMPRPFYTAFVSRGVRSEDRLVSDQIVDVISGWGFDPFTAGIEYSFEKGKVTKGIRGEIVKRDCLIAIATPRILDALSGLWRTLEWLHGETGIAWGLDKPMLIMKEKGLLIEGLPSYLIEEEQTLAIEFDSLNLGHLRTKLQAIMPSFREWIASRRRAQFINTLVSIASIAIPALITGGIVGYLLGSSKR